MTAPGRLLPPRGRRGYALILVLWTLVLISLLVSQLAATGAREARIASNLAQAATAEAAADGALYAAVFHLLDDSPSAWTLDGKDHRLKIDGGTVTVRIVSELGKVNPNTAPPELLQALLMGLRVRDEDAGKIAAAIVDWRESELGDQADAAKVAAYEAAGMDHGPPGSPFQTLDEIGRVLGVTPALLAALKPHLTLYQPGLPDAAFSDPVVREAYATLKIDPDDEQPHGLGLDAVTITADARMDGGGRFIRRAIVRLGAAYDHGYAIAEWNRAPAD